MNPWLAAAPVVMAFTALSALCWAAVASMRPGYAQVALVFFAVFGTFVMGVAAYAVAREAWEDSR